MLFLVNISGRCKLTHSPGPGQEVIAQTTQKSILSASLFLLSLSEGNIYIRNCTHLAINSLLFLVHICIYVILTSS